VTEKGKDMKNQITCPHCKRTISDNPIVDSAATAGEHKMGSDFIICECGERISFWAITAQLREQKTFGRKFQGWFQALLKG